MGVYGHQGQMDYVNVGLLWYNEVTAVFGGCIKIAE